MTLICAQACILILGRILLQLPPGPGPRKKLIEEAEARSERSGSENVTRKACDRVVMTMSVVMTMKAPGTKFKFSLPFLFLLPPS